VPLLIDAITLTPLLFRHTPCHFSFHAITRCDADAFAAAIDIELPLILLHTPLPLAIDIFSRHAIEPPLMPIFHIITPLFSLAAFSFSPLILLFDYYSSAEDYFRFR
jgi:hypothetical protein